MQVKKRMISGVVMIVMLLSSISICLAAEGSTQVTYTSSGQGAEIIEDNVSIKAVGNGTVTDGKQTIRNTTYLFNLTKSKTRTFTLVPDVNNVVEVVRVNGVDVTTSIKDNRITITGQDKHQEVYVQFSGSKINQRVDTSDQDKVKMWMLIALSTSILIVYLVNKKPKEEQ